MGNGTPHHVPSGKHVHENYTPLTPPPPFYIANLGYAEVPDFLIFAPNHRLWVLVWSKTKKTIKNFQPKIFNFYNYNKNLYIAWTCFCNQDKKAQWKEKVKQVINTLPCSICIIPRKISKVKPRVISTVVRFKHL